MAWTSGTNLSRTRTRTNFPTSRIPSGFVITGCFYVAPAQKSFMLRCRIPAGEMTSMQLRGLADLAAEWGGGYADITTRANFQVREIAPRNMVKCLLKLQEIGLTARGSGVDNVRNITATPTAGIDRHELIDPGRSRRRFTTTFLTIATCMICPANSTLRSTAAAPSPPSRILTTSVSSRYASLKERVSNQEFIFVWSWPASPVTSSSRKTQVFSLRPDQCVAVAAAIIRVFVENGDRTNRKRARLKYVIDKWGIPKYIEEVEKKLAFPLRRSAARPMRAADGADSARSHRSV